MQTKVILFCYLRWEVIDVTDITEENRMAYMQLWKKPEKIQTWTWTGAHNLCDCTLGNSTKLFYNLSYWAIREVVKCIRILKRASMETVRPQRQWREGLKSSFPYSLQACEFVKNLTSNKLLRALNFHCKKMKKLKFWISTLMWDWHIFVSHFSTDMALYFAQELNLSSVSLLVTYFATCRNQRSEKMSGPSLEYQSPYNFEAKNVVPLLKSWQITFSTMSPADPRTTSNRLFGEKSSWTQNATSLYVGGYLLNDLNSEIVFSSNCDRNLGSSLQNSLMSGILKSFIARRSKPIPNAQPILCSAPPWKKY